MSVDPKQLQNIVEGALLAAGKPLTLQQLQNLFEGSEPVPEREHLLEALDAIEVSLEGRGFELRRVASGYRLQVRAELAPWVGRLWEEKPQRYSRALLETLALIAYRQPLTRGEIEEVRGVAVSTNIIRTLLERDWVRVVGHREVPGKPALYATTKTFLDYFNLQSLGQLPSLAEIQDLEQLQEGLEPEALDAADLAPAIAPAGGGPDPESSAGSDESTVGEAGNGAGTEPKTPLPSNVIALPGS